MHFLQIFLLVVKLAGGNVLPSVSCGESSFSIITGGFDCLCSSLHHSTPGGGHQIVINLERQNCNTVDILKNHVTKVIGPTIF